MSTPPVKEPAFVYTKVEPPRATKAPAFAYAGMEPPSVHKTDFEDDRLYLDMEYETPEMRVIREKRHQAYLEKKKKSCNLQ